MDDKRINSNIYLLNHCSCIDTVWKIDERLNNEGRNHAFSILPFSLQRDLIYSSPFIQYALIPYDHTVILQIENKI